MGRGGGRKAPPPEPQKLVPIPSAYTVSKAKAPALAPKATAKTPPPPERRNPQHGQQRQTTKPHRCSKGEEQKRVDRKLDLALRTVLSAPRSDQHGARADRAEQLESRGAEQDPKMSALLKSAGLLGFQHDAFAAASAAGAAWESAAQLLDSPMKAWLPELADALSSSSRDDEDDPRPGTMLPLVPEVEADYTRSGSSDALRRILAAFFVVDNAGTAKSTSVSRDARMAAVHGSGHMCFDVVHFGDPDNASGTPHDPRAPDPDSARELKTEVENSNTGVHHLYIDGCERLFEDVCARQRAMREVAQTRVLQLALGFLDLKACQSRWTPGAELICASGAFVLARCSSSADKGGSWPAWEARWASTYRARVQHLENSEGSSSSWSIAELQAMLRWSYRQELLKLAVKRRLWVHLESCGMCLDEQTSRTAIGTEGWRNLVMANEDLVMANDMASFSSADLRALSRTFQLDQDAFALVKEKINAAAGRFGGMSGAYRVLAADADWDADRGEYVWKDEQLALMEKAAAARAEQEENDRPKLIETARWKRERDGRLFRHWEVNEKVEQPSSSSGHRLRASNLPARKTHVRSFEGTPVREEYPDTPVPSVFDWHGRVAVDLWHTGKGRRVSAAEAREEEAREDREEGLIFALPVRILDEPDSDSCISRPASASPARRTKSEDEVDLQAGPAAKRRKQDESASERRPQGDDDRERADPRRGERAALVKSAIWQAVRRAARATATSRVEARPRAIGAASAIVTAIALALASENANGATAIAAASAAASATAKIANAIAGRAPAARESAKEIMREPRIGRKTSPPPKPPAAENIAAVENRAGDNSGKAGGNSRQRRQLQRRQQQAVQAARKKFDAEFPLLLADRSPGAPKLTLEEAFNAQQAAKASSSRSSPGAPSRATPYLVGRIKAARNSEFVNRGFDLEPDDLQVGSGEFALRGTTHNFAPEGEQSGRAVALQGWHEAVKADLEGDAGAEKNPAKKYQGTTFLPVWFQLQKIGERIHPDKIRFAAAVDEEWKKRKAKAEEEVWEALVEKKDEEDEEQGKRVSAEVEKVDKDKAPAAKKAAAKANENEVNKKSRVAPPPPWTALKQQKHKAAGPPGDVTSPATKGTGGASVTKATSATAGTARGVKAASIPSALLAGAARSTKTKTKKGEDTNSNSAQRGGGQIAPSAEFDPLAPPIPDFYHQGASAASGTPVATTPVTTASGYNGAATLGCYQAFNAGAAGAPALTGVAVVPTGQFHGHQSSGGGAAMSAPAGGGGAMTVGDIAHDPATGVCYRCVQVLPDGTPQWELAGGEGYQHHQVGGQLQQGGPFLQQVVASPVEQASLQNQSSGGEIEKQMRTEKLKTPAEMLAEEQSAFTQEWQKLVANDKKYDLARAVSKNDFGEELSASAVLDVLRRAPLACFILPFLRDWLRQDPPLVTFGDPFVLPTPTVKPKEPQLPDLKEPQLLLLLSNNTLRWVDVLLKALSPSVESQGATLCLRSHFESNLDQRAELRTDLERVRLFYVRQALFGSGGDFLKTLTQLKNLFQKVVCGLAIPDAQREVIETQWARLKGIERTHGALTITAAQKGEVFLKNFVHNFIQTEARKQLNVAGCKLLKEAIVKAEGLTQKRDPGGAASSWLLPGQGGDQKQDRAGPQSRGILGGRRGGAEVLAKASGMFGGGGVSSSSSTGAGGQGHKSSQSIAQQFLLNSNALICDNSNATSISKQNSSKNSQSADSSQQSSPSGVSNSLLGSLAQGPSDVLKLLLERAAAGVATGRGGGLTASIPGKGPHQGTANASNSFSHLDDFLRSITKLGGGNRNGKDNTGAASADEALYADLIEEGGNNAANLNASKTSNQQNKASSTLQIGNSSLFQPANRRSEQASVVASSSSLVVNNSTASASSLEIQELASLALPTSSASRRKKDDDLTEDEDGFSDISYDPLKEEPAPAAVSSSSAAKGEVVAEVVGLRGGAAEVSKKKQHQLPVASRLGQQVKAEDAPSHLPKPNPPSLLGLSRDSLSEQRKSSQAAASKKESTGRKSGEMKETVQQGGQQNINADLKKEQQQDRNPARPEEEGAARPAARESLYGDLELDASHSNKPRVDKQGDELQNELAQVRREIVDCTKKMQEDKANKKSYKAERDRLEEREDELEEMISKRKEPLPQTSDVDALQGLLAEEENNSRNKPLKEELVKFSLLNPIAGENLPGTTTGTATASTKNKLFSAAAAARDLMHRPKKSSRFDRDEHGHLTENQAQPPAMAITSITAAQGPQDNNLNFQEDNFFHSGDKTPSVVQSEDCSSRSRVAVTAEMLGMAAASRSTTGRRSGVSEPVTAEMLAAANNSDSVPVTAAMLAAAKTSVLPPPPGSADRKPNVLPPPEPSWRQQAGEISDNDDMVDSREGTPANSKMIPAAGAGNEAPPTYPSQKVSNANFSQKQLPLPNGGSQWPVSELI
eukprot:g8683.t1